MNRMDRTPRVKLKQGRTRRCDLAVRAYRLLSVHAEHDHRPRSPRHFVLRQRLEAVLAMLSPAELAAYQREVSVMEQGR